MSEGYVDLTPILRAVQTVSNQVAAVDSRATRNFEIVNQNMETVRRQTMNEMAIIKKKLVEMERQQKLSAALQRAITEVIRIRQELESKFGTHKQVRNNMLGILQASDLALIKNETISRCTEELMLSAPKYWLAPCLIALAAWISDDKPLAERALREALKRDREKACLLFALITRRVNAGREEANQTSTPFEWLAEYFKMQDPFRMRSSIVAYIDAYSNGVFGDDERKLCQGHVNHWMQVLKEKNPAFAEEQKQYWTNVFNSYCSGISSTRYSELSKICVQFDQIQQYLDRIDASERDDGIKNFITGIVETKVDVEKLTADIDEQLIRLVTNYEEDEAQLRDEEQFMEFVKEFKGDEDRAANVMRAVKARRMDEPVDFVLRLSSAILQNDATPSAKKTAVRLLQPYISEAFGEFITAYKEAYPQEVDLRIAEAAKVLNGQPFTWTGKTQNAENRTELVGDLAAKYDDAKKKSLGLVTDDEANKKIKTGKIVGWSLCWTIIGAIVGISMCSKGKKMLKENEEKRGKITRYYDKAKADSLRLLNSALDERVQANEAVESFLAVEGNEAINF